MEEEIVLMEENDIEEIEIEEENYSGKPYQLPIASNEVLGGIKVGENLTIDEDGTLNAQAGGGGGIVEETDPTVPSYVKAITQEDINKWNSGTGSDVDLSEYAKKTEVPKRLGQLTNDVGYLDENDFKTINGVSIVGEGNININSGSGGEGGSNVVVSPTQPTSGEEVWLQKSVNLYNLETDTRRIYIDEDGAEKEDITCNVTDYIRVEPNKNYTYQGLTYTSETSKFYSAYYDINKNLVSTFRLTEETGTITIPENIYYVRISVNNSDYRIFQFEEGTIAGEYQEYVDDEIYTKASDSSYSRFGAKHSEVTETNYELLEYKPQINGVELKGNVSTAQLGFPQYTAGTGISLVNNVITATGTAEVETEDTGWLSAELTSSFRDYYDSGDYHPQYRKRDKIVSIRGIVKPRATISSGGTAIIFTLPEGFRPSYEISKVCAGSSKNTWLMYISRNGNVSLNRYGTTANASCGTSAYLPFECTFMID